MKKVCFVSVLFAIMFVFGCEDENPEIAKDMFFNDIMGVLRDTISDKANENDIIIHTLNDEGVINNVTNGYVGVFNHPMFGRTKAACAFQLMTTGKYTFEDGAEVKSVFLYLQYRGAYYDTITPQKIKVYQLKKEIKDVKKVADFNKMDFVYSGEDIGSSDLNYKNIVDTLVRNIDTLYNDDKTIKEIKRDTILSNYLKIKLKNSFGEKFIKNSSESDFYNQESFLEFFKGLYIEPEYSGTCGGLYAFNISSGTGTGSSTIRTHLEIQYRNTKEDNKNYLQLMSSEILDKINLFENTPLIGSDYEKFRNNESIEHERTYIIGASGSKINIAIKDLDTWKDSVNCSINKAQIIIKTYSVDSSNDTTFHNDNTIKNSEGTVFSIPVPSYLVMVGMDKDDKTVLLNDYKSNLLGGLYDKSKKQYTFNITYVLQDIINGESNIDITKGLFVYPNNRRENPLGVILDNKSVEFRITYTKL